MTKGSPSLPLSMNFWKSSKGGRGGHFRSKKFRCNFFCIRNCTFGHEFPEKLWNMGGGGGSFPISINTTAVRSCLSTHLLQKHIYYNDVLLTDSNSRWTVAKLAEWLDKDSQLSKIAANCSEKGNGDPKMRTNRMLTRCEMDECGQCRQHLLPAILKMKIDRINQTNHINQGDV